MLNFRSFTVPFPLGGTVKNILFDSHGLKKVCSTQGVLQE